MRLFPPFEFDKFSNDSVFGKKRKLEYIKQMIILAKDDKKAIFLYITIALLSIAFVLNKFDPDISNTNTYIKILFYIGIILLLLSAALNFAYWRTIHMCQMRITSCIPNLNIDKARDLWISVWKNNKLLFKAGLILMVLGFLIVFTILILIKI